jgi:uncharacterized protein YuzE
MTAPLKIEIDSKAGAGYVKYTDKKIATTIDVWEDGQVAADLDGDGAIVGIEILDLDEPTITHAQAFAAEHDLAFPQIEDLGGRPSTSSG